MVSVGDKGMERCRKRQCETQSLWSLSKSHYWRVGWMNIWTNEVQSDWQRELMNRSGNGWWDRWIAYWTRILMLQQHWQTMFVLSSWCCVYVCVCVSVQGRLGLFTWAYTEIDDDRFWFVWALEIKYSAGSSGWKHLKTNQSLSGGDNIFFISAPKNIHVCRSKAFLFEIHRTLLSMGYLLILFT